MAVQSDGCKDGCPTRLSLRKVGDLAAGFCSFPDLQESCGTFEDFGKSHDLDWDHTIPYTILGKHRDKKLLLRQEKDPPERGSKTNRLFLYSLTWLISLVRDWCDKWHLTCLLLDEMKLSKMYSDIGDYRACCCWTTNLRKDERQQFCYQKACPKSLKLSTHSCSMTAAVVGCGSHCPANLRMDVSHAFDHWQAVSCLLRTFVRNLGHRPPCLRSIKTGLSMREKYQAQVNLGLFFHIFF